MQALALRPETVRTFENAWLGQEDSNSHIQRYTVLVARTRRHFFGRKEWTSAANGASVSPRGLGHLAHFEACPAGLAATCGASVVTAPDAAATEGSNNVSQQNLQ
jgi:hypothetical protein